MFRGDCWPGESVWIDFFNEAAASYWGSLYEYSQFKGTSKAFGYWVDMNEPSVFSGDELTFPKNAYHIRTNGDAFPHRDIRNSYGLLASKASYEGIIRREPD